MYNNNNTNQQYNPYGGAAPPYQQQQQQPYQYPQQQQPPQPQQQPVYSMPYHHQPTSSTHQKKTLKIVILGDSGVGKTSLMNRYATGKFTGQYKATIGADFLSKETVVTDVYGQRHLCTLQIWDTAGQERFQSLGVGFYRGADCAILVYDITDPTSLDNLNHWKQEFLNQVGTNIVGSSSMGSTADHAPPFPFVVLGNKADKEKDRLVPVQRAEEWCRDNAGIMGMMGSGVPLVHYQTSAKTASNVDEAFHEVSRLALQYEDYRRKSQPQLFIPPPSSAEPIDLRRQNSSTVSDNNQQGCC